MPRAGCARMGGWVSGRRGSRSEVGSSVCVPLGPLAVRRLLKPRFLQLFTRASEPPVGLPAPPPAPPRPTPVCLARVVGGAVVQLCFSCFLM